MKIKRTVLTQYYINFEQTFLPYLNIEVFSVSTT